MIMSQVSSNADILGKKVFFLHPTVVVQNRIIEELIQHEYEIYIAKNKEKLRKLLREFPDSIVFVDINEHIAETEWEIWIRGMMEAPDCKDISVGIVTTNENEQLKQKYLTSIKVPCGYTIVGHDLQKAIERIVLALQEASAKGRRKYIRAVIERGDPNIAINLSLDGVFVNGQIKDISVVGISCTFEGNPEIPKNTLLKDIQVRLQTSLLKAEGIIFGSRMESMEKIYVLLFTQRIDPEVRTKIRKYIQYNLQNKMNFKLT